MTTSTTSAPVSRQLAWPPVGERRRAKVERNAIAEVRNINYLMDFFAIELLKVNSYGTKKDILPTFFMDN